ncbi:hypothetical protein [Homoserinimonas sp. A520]
MNNKRKWTAVGAASALGIGLVAGGGVLTANAMTIHDTTGEKVGTDKVSTGASNSVVDSAQSAPDAPITTTSTPATTSVTPNGSAVSAVTAVSAQSAVSAVDPASAPSAD